MSTTSIDPPRRASTKFTQIQHLLSIIIPVSRGAAGEIIALDGLRALAVLLVFWLHSGAYPPASSLSNLASFGASYGVLLFFNLSGFLLFLPYARAIFNERSLPSTRKFYLRRILRILPLYYTVTLLLVFFQEPQFLNHAHRIPLLLNLLMLGDIRYDSFGAISPQFWTLSIEFQFYLLLPLIAWGLSKIAGRNVTRWSLVRIVVALIGLIVYGLILRCIVDYYYYTKHIDLIARQDTTGYVTSILYGVGGKFPEVFALGIGVSFLYVLCVEQRKLSLQRRYVLGILTLICALIMAAIGIYLNSKFKMLPYWAVDMQWQNFSGLGIGCCCMALLLAVLFCPPFIQAIWAFYPLRYIGLISYGIYVWHFSLLQALAPTIIQSHPNDGTTWLFFVGLVVTLAFSTVSYYLVERPFLQLRLGLRQQSPAISPQSSSFSTQAEIETTKRPIVQTESPIEMNTLP